MWDSFGEGDFDILDGEELQNRIAFSSTLPRRDSFPLVAPWLYSNSPKILFLTGLRRTGKTTIMEQTIAEMTSDMFNKTVFFQAHDERIYDMLDIIGVMRELYEKGKRFFFLDEVTFADNFPAGCMRLSDGFAKNGCRVCVTGTHSLAIWLAKTNYMQGRYEEIKTTSIPFAEWNRLLFPGTIQDTDTYLLQGGILDLPGITTKTALAARTRDDDLSTHAGATLYTHRAVALNIQNAILKHKDGEFLGDLRPLCDEGLLTDAVARVVQNQGHQSTLSVLNKLFVSDDMRMFQAGVANESFATMLNRSWKEIGKRMADAIGIINGRRPIRKEEAKAIADWLYDIDFFVNAPTTVMSMDGTERKEARTILAQPALRTEQMLSTSGLFLEFLDEAGIRYDARRTEDLIRSAVLGRMQEDVVLYELKSMFPCAKIFALKIRDGGTQIAEYDVAVRTPDGVALIEIKHDTEYKSKYSQYLRNTDALQSIEDKYGPILSKTVLYRGDSNHIGDIEWTNLGEFLSNREGMAKRLKIEESTTTPQGFIKI
ncbi:MAG: AAA family ATPase [Desulfovibrio sp.]|nr:AAA family ATPase [Desulfovibrio sp.]